MLTYKNIVHDYITMWTRTILESHNSKSALCVFTGGSDSALNAAMLLRSTSHIPVNIIFIGFKKENNEIFENWIVKNFAYDHYKIIKPVMPNIVIEDFDALDIRPSMIPAFTDIYSKINNSITFGSLTKSEYSLVKFFKTRVDDIFDYYPLIDLYKSECAELSGYIGLPDKLSTTKSITEESFGYTYEELEWLDRENDNLSIVSAMDYPNFAPHWGFFNDRKKSLVLKVYNMNKTNKLRTIDSSKLCLIRKSMPGSIV